MNKTAPKTVDQFIQLSGPLFKDVQQSGLFPDSKTFVDSVPKTDPKIIRKKYLNQKKDSQFNLNTFVREHFLIAGENEAGTFESADTMHNHIERLWDYLGRQADDAVSDYSTLIPLPHPYIVPGGRFREIYYWDTYFTAEGLAASGRMDMVENLCRNFAHLIKKIGHVPNGNRYYYVSRSQPPFLVMLVDLIARKKGDYSIKEFIPALEKEYQFWMNGSSALADNETHRRLVNVDGSILNRYWDDRPLPREESWREDFELAKELELKQEKEIYRHLRAGAESGWDYSSRWFSDGNRLSTIQTTDILPIDLNALLWFLEKKLAEWTGKKSYKKAANQRKEAIKYIFWNDTAGWYFDYNFKLRQQTDIWSLAGAYPLFTGIASQQQADSAAHILKNKFLKDGGLVSTLHNTGQQWDHPNGWAPLQWVAVKGLMNYGHDEPARTIADRWLRLNKSVFNRTGQMMEKYNVCDISLEAGGGEYPLQDGFGWTNGVAVALQKMIDDK